MKPTENTPSVKAGSLLKMTETAVMLALATVLSLVKLIDLPYGGSVTVASLLPLLIIAVRYGAAWGFVTGTVYGVLQLLLGSSLSYVTGFWSVVAVIVLDYLAAFCAVGIAGWFRRLHSQPRAMVLGAVAVGAARYACHVVSGATVWAGISIPTSAAMAYSLAYNATYMLPETVVLAAAAYFVGSVLDFRSPTPNRLPRPAQRGIGWLKAAATALVAVAAGYDVLAIFPYLQDPETGNFTLAQLGSVSWLSVGIVSAVAVVAALIMTAVSRSSEKRA